MERLTKRNTCALASEYQSPQRLELPVSPRAVLKVIFHIGTNSKVTAVLGVRWLFAAEDVESLPYAWCLLTSERRFDREGATRYPQLIPLL
jgi:hypothetical protein